MTQAFYLTWLEESPRFFIQEKIKMAKKNLLAKITLPIFAGIFFLGNCTQKNYSHSIKSEGDFQYLGDLTGDNIPDFYENKKGSSFIYLGELEINHKYEKLGYKFFRISSKGYQVKNSEKDGKLYFQDKNGKIHFLKVFGAGPGSRPE